MARDLDGTTDYLTTASMPVTAYPFTMACWFRPDTFSDALMWMGDNGVTNQYCVVDLLSGNVRAGAAAGGTVNNAVSTGGGGGVGVWQHACGVFASATSRAAFRNGGLKGTTATSRAFPTNADQLAIGMNRSSSPASDYDGRVAEACVWNVALNDFEVAALASGVSPYLIRPGNLVFYAPIWGNTSPEPDYNPVGTKRPLTINGTAAQAGHSPTGPMLFDDQFPGMGASLNHYTLDAQPGSFTITGAAAGVLADRMINAVAGSYSITGADATLPRGYFIDAQPGSFAITGAQAALLADRLINAGPGSYALTGAAATLERGYNLNAEPGSFVVTGAAAAVLADRHITADPGSFTITGVAAMVIRELTLNAEPGAFVITGFLVDGDNWVVGYELNAEPGTFTISGADAGIPAGRALDAQPGSYAVSGAAAGLLADRVLNAQSGSYSVTGTAAGLLVARELAAMPGSFIITGADAGLAHAGQPQLVATGRIVLIQPSGTVISLASTPRIVEVVAEGEVNTVDVDGEVVVIDAEGDVWRL